MLSYCEICGDVIKGESGADLPEGVICDGCFDSRKAVVGSGSDDGERVQFECAYCRSLLRLPPVVERTSVRCPQCAETFYLLAEGKVEARMEGNTTAIISKEEAIRSLTPGSINLAATQSLKAEQNKTQPMSPISKAHKKVLRELASKNLDVVAELPERKLLPVDTKRRERRKKSERFDRRALEDADTEVQIEPYGSGKELRPSDEGKIDLDVGRLKDRQATRRLGSSPKAEKSAAATKTKAERKKDKAERKKDKDERKKDREEKRARREERKTKALARGEELQRGKVQRWRRALLLWSLLGAPLLVVLLLISMTTRGAGFAVRGAFGEQLGTMGVTFKAGVREFNGLLPDPLQQPLPETD